MHLLGPYYIPGKDIFSLIFNIFAVVLKPFFLVFNIFAEVLKHGSREKYTNILNIIMFAKRTAPVFTRHL